jgi:hypothetical protein
MPNGTSKLLFKFLFQIVIRLLSLARFLVTSQGDAHPSWSQMLAPKMKLSFWSSFVVDSMAIGSFQNSFLSFSSCKT